MTFASVGLAPGYPGAGMNPARCFAFAVARGEFRRKFEPFHIFQMPHESMRNLSVADVDKIDQWIWWVGPLAGSLLLTAVYYIAPPYHREKRHDVRPMRAQVPSVQFRD